MKNSKEKKNQNSLCSFGLTDMYGYQVLQKASRASRIQKSLTDIKNYMRSFLFFALQKKHAPPLGKKSQHCGRLQHSFSFLDGTCSRRNSAGTDTLLGSFFFDALQKRRRLRPLLLLFKLKVEKALLEKQSLRKSFSLE